MKKEIEAIIFDCGGVLKKNTFEMINFSICKKFKLDFFSVQQLSRKHLADLEINRINGRQFWNRVLTELSEISESNVSLEDIYCRWKYSYESNAKFFREADELVKKLNTAGYKLAVLSNTVRKHGEYNKKMGRFRNFHTIVLSYEAGFRKPEKEIYQLVLDKLDLPSQQCLFIDDKKENLITAESLGINTILFQDYSRLKKELRLIGLDF